MKKKIDAKFFKAPKNAILLCVSVNKYILPFHVHIQCRQPGACAVFDSLYDLPLHWCTTAAYMVSRGEKTF